MVIAIRPLTAEESKAAIRADARQAVDHGLLVNACPYGRQTDERDTWVSEFFRRHMQATATQGA